jgi:uncharacterized protein YbjQ (UPF0145 family)
MIIATTNELPGYTITQTLGEVMGVTVRSLNVGASWVASIRAIGGGELPEYSKTMHDARAEVLNRLAIEVHNRGGNAVAAMRFDAGAIGQYIEICAYGTAVVIEPVAA